MGNKRKSERFQAATLHLCTGWVKAVWSAVGHSAALSFLPAVLESQSALMAAMAAQSTVLQRSWVSEQSSHPEKQPAAEEKAKEGLPGGAPAV